jgi:hypothetical protein
MWKNMGTNLGWKEVIDDILVVDSIVITCMSPFSNPLLEKLIQCQNFWHTQTCNFANIVHGYFYEVISPPWEWLWLELPCSTNHNANVHSLNLPCFYLQFNQKWHTYWTSLTSKSKSSIVITNQTSFIGKTTIVQEKKKNLPKWIW